MGVEKLDKMVQLRMNSTQVKRAHLVDTHVRSKSLLVFVYSDSLDAGEQSEASSSLIEDIEFEQVNQEIDEQEEHKDEEEPEL